MTPEQLIAAFTAAGLDTPEKLAPLLALMVGQAQKIQLELSIARLQAERAAANSAAETELQTLTAQMAALDARLRG